MSASVGKPHGAGREAGTFHHGKTMSIGVKQAIDFEHVAEALEILVDQQHPFEIRAFPGAHSRVKQGSDINGIIHAVDDLATSDFIYYCLNPLGPDVSVANDKGVSLRRWFFIDVDPVKEDPHASSTDAEKEQAALVAAEIVEYLVSVGWPSPLLIDSGNGYHLLYRIDLPNDSITHSIIKKALYALGRFDSDGATIDKSVHNASRLAKLPGTWAKKGTSTEERPHRICRIIVRPNQLECVSVELLKALASNKEQKKYKPMNGSASAYGRRALESEVMRVFLAPAGERNDTLNKAAFSLGQLVAGGVLDRHHVEAQLRIAAERCGLVQDPGCGQRGVDNTIRSGIEAGLEHPRKEPQGKSASESIPKEETVILRASAVTPRKVEWLWPGRIPLAKLTTFAGVGGLGKTFVLCDITARVTRGKEWPDSPEQCEQGQVLFVSGEDDPDDTLVPRLMELGADLDKVSFLRTEVQDKFTLADLPTLDRALAEMGEGVRFVAIDPPTAYLGSVDDHKNAALRGLLSPLKSWAQKRRVAIVFNTHINKAIGKVDAMMRVMGSVAWVNAVRAAHMFARDPDDPERRLMVGMKMNIAKERKGLAYRIASTHDDLARVEWLGEVDTTANEALNQDTAKPRRVVASEWLVERFRERLEWESDELFKAAKATGVSRDAVFEAKTRLLLPKARQVIHENGDRVWVWWVPPDWPPLTQQGGNT